MKRQINSFKRTGFIHVALCAALCGTGAAFGQGPGNGSGNGQNQGNGPGGFRRPPLPPIIQALDTNHDGIIEASEIDNAAQSLRTLEKSGTDQLTIPELLGPPHHRPPPPGQGWGQGQGNGGGQGSDMQSANPGAQSSPPPQNSQGGPGGNGGQGNNQDGPPGPPPGQNGPGGPGRHRPLPPVIQALDTNHDGIIEASEIDNAPQSLRTLEKGGMADQLTIPQLLGPPPHRPPPPGWGQGPGNDDGPPPPPPDGQEPPNPAQSGTNGQDGPPPPPPPPPQ